MVGAFLCVIEEQHNSEECDFERKFERVFLGMFANHLWEQRPCYMKAEVNMNEAALCEALIGNKTLQTLHLVSMLLSVQDRN